MIDVRRWLGVEHVKGGRDPETGLDCWGLIRSVYHDEYGIDLPCYSTEQLEVSERAELAALFENEAGFWEEIPIDDAREGDVLTLSRGRLPIHAGIYIPNGLILHAMERIGVAVQRLDMFEGIYEVSGCFRYPRQSG